MCQTWTHLCENTLHHLNVGTGVVLPDSVEPAVGVSAKAEQELHHLAESAVAGDLGLSLPRHAVVLAYASLRRGDLGYAHSKN